jgi:GT2 family glycosyltransferase
MDLLIVIVNYRTAGLTLDCLRSLEPEVKSLAAVARVVVTDNASPDDSVDQLQRAVAEHQWSDWVTIQPLPSNGGFAYGNNEAIRPALASADPPRSVLLLNPDTIVRPGALGALLTFLDSHPAAGLVGPALEGPDGARVHSAFRFHSALSELESGMRLGLASRLLARRSVLLPMTDGPHQADWVSGACLLVRREVFESIGLLDEGYFMYYEETDLCLRARREGWECWCVPQARVAHLEGMSAEGIGPPPSARRRPAYWFSSRRRYFLKNLGRAHTIAADLAWSSGFATFRVRQFLQRKPDHDHRLLLWDFIRHNFLSAGR